MDYTPCFETEPHGAHEWRESPGRGSNYVICGGVPRVDTEDQKRLLDLIIALTDCYNSIDEHISRKDVATKLRELADDYDPQPIVEASPLDIGHVCSREDLKAGL